MDSPSSAVASYYSPYFRGCPPLDPGSADSPPTQHRRAPNYLGPSSKLATAATDCYSRRSSYKEQENRGFR
ncbi:unnamed protein product [Linum trigynum]|uniref:Uncharacterized protein n=1 Tax=Linum trigynum TaxID=586398 RepID=A0AAV2FRA8_9ROSI